MNKTISSLLLIFAVVISFPLLTSANDNLGDTYLSEEIQGYCEEIGDLYGVCPELIMSIIEHESGGRPDAVSSSGAVGLMQIIPKYQQDRMNELGVKDIYDPYSNILVGTDMIMEYAGKYEDLYLVLMVYNQGEYSNAMNQYEAGRYSRYAVNIVDRSTQLERLHNK